MSEDKATGQKWLFSEPAEKREWPAGARMRQVGATIVQEFDTLRDAIEAAEFSHPKNRDQWADTATGKGKENKRAHWYGIDGGPADVAALVRDGWPEGVQRMREALDDMGATLAPQNVRRVRRWADSGDSVEMPRVWAGRAVR